MTDKQPTADEQPADLAAFAADTLLLDALGSGAPAPPGDRVASLLAAWRADLDAELLTTDVDDSAVERDPAADPEVARLLAAAAADPSAGTGVTTAGTHARRGAGRSRRVAQRVLGVAAAVLAAAGGGLVVGAGHATPGSPLWPITRVVYREQADSAQAEHTLALARKAATEGRVADARLLLTQADTLIARVSDPDRASRLRATSKAVRDLLPAGTSSPSAPAPAPSAPGPAATGGPVPGTGAPTPGPLPTTAVPQPKPTAGGNQILPPIGTGNSPGLPLPTIPPSVGPLPLPTGLLPKLP
ncbi:hypothetical protein HC031_31035 [Planosporangium thailandense]|uniref:Anti-sigma-D factor RsdA sigma factor binding region domain-containing protein n=1 Tax=Planosporangium thailandense TaxID=765197 RepID=A0ABX0Y6S4_9ACTN|nr:hypothetical protein [Planosporangium thailandense]NJC74114.1 hypothetical protein [Planosporangium thailandense]